MSDLQRPQKVLVTGGSGFVGRYVVRELLARGYTPICLARDPARLRRVVPEAAPSQIVTVRGDLHDDAALHRAAAQAQAVIHLVGIIFDRWLKGQTFARIHVEGTRRVLAAAQAAGISRFVHMSALGARPDGVSEYQRTKGRAEEIVRNSGIAWTIFRPSIIHGPDGEFMQLMKTFVTLRPVWHAGIIPQQVPFVPYFGDGNHRVQPVWVRDVAHCFVACLDMPATVRRSFDLGGPDSMTWRELYRTCRELIPGAVRFKPMIGLPVPLALLLARTLMRTPLVPLPLRFNAGQVRMSQEDSVCDPRPVEETFGLRLRGFREELSRYADQIR